MKPAWQLVRCWWPAVSRLMIFLGERSISGHLAPGSLMRRPLVVIALACGLGACGGGWLSDGGRGVGAVLADHPGVSMLFGWGLATLLVVVAGRRSLASASRVCILVAAMVITAGLWAWLQMAIFTQADIAWSLHEEYHPIVVEALVTAPIREISPPADLLGLPSCRAAAHTCQVRILAARNGASWKSAEGKCRVIIDGRPSAALVRGCRVRLVGRGCRPAVPLNPGEVDLRLQARRERCLSMIRVAGPEAVLIISPPSWRSVDGLLNFIDCLRTHGTRLLMDSITPARLPLAQALLLGSREALPRADAERFMATGTIHILAISGLHVGMVAGALFFLLRCCLVPHAAAAAAVALVACLYMLLVHAEVPVVRATWIVWLACLAGVLRRRMDCWQGLALALLVILVWQPAAIFRTGTQLSFLATATLVAVAERQRPSGRKSIDPIDRLIERSRTPRERLLGKGRDALLLAGTAALAVWLVTAPLVASRFHIVPLVGLPLNLLMGPLVAVAMATGFCCLVLGSLWLPLARLPGAVCDVSLGLINGLVAWAEGLPGAQWWVSGLPEWWVVGWSIGAVGLGLGGGRTPRAWPARWLATACVWGLVGCIITTGGRWGMAVEAFLTKGKTAASLEAIVTSVGHGCGIILRSPSGRCLVYDAGRLGGATSAGRSMAAVLWDRGIRRIDLLVISHADADHFNGVPDLLRKFDVGRLVVSPTFLAHPSPMAAALLTIIERRRIPIEQVHAGSLLDFDPGCTVRVLHPSVAEPVDDRVQSDNESSIVLAVEAAGRRLLLMGDLEGPALARWIAAAPPTCDVLVAPHHGTVTSLPPDVAAVTSPAFVVVSGVGGPRWADVRRGYASAAAAQTGREAIVVKTGGTAAGGHGAVRIKLAADGVRMSQFQDRSWGSPQRPLQAESLVAIASPRPPGTADSGPEN
jgi:competence protein ComEC